MRLNQPHLIHEASIDIITYGDVLFTLILMEVLMIDTT